MFCTKHSQNIGGKEKKKLYKEIILMFLHVLGMFQAKTSKVASSDRSDVGESHRHNYRANNCLSLINAHYCNITPHTIPKYH